MHRTRRSVLVIVLMLQGVNLFLSPTTALQHVSAEQTDEDFDFRLDFVSKSHHVAGSAPSRPEPP